MWARVTEFFVGIWLLASPFVFQDSNETTSVWILDIGTGVVLIAVAILSFLQPLRRYHVIVPIAGLWLIGAAFLSGSHPVPPAQQNHIMVGLVLLMLGIVPNQATSPPRKWREFNRGESAGEGSASHRSVVQAREAESGHPTAAPTREASRR